MSRAKVSVIVPTYGGADFLGEAIRSVLDQTYANFELIIVNDASPDDTDAVLRQYPDPRIHYIVHPTNQGAPIARSTALRASSGEIIAFLDQDDLFHPQKLQAHVEFLEENPEIGFSYNARFELNHSSRTIRTVWRPPSELGLKELVFGFPMSPSDMVLRREWAEQVDFTDREMRFHGGEIVITGRLFLSGCRFAGLAKALNYRRYHPGRIFSKLAERCASEIASQKAILDDPRCPPEVRALQELAFMNSYRIWAYLALRQGETELAQRYLCEAVRLQPTLIEGQPCELVDFLATQSVEDEEQDLERLLDKLFRQLPPELQSLKTQQAWAIGRAYLLKGVFATIWEGSEKGPTCLSRAAKLGAEIDESMLQTITYQLLNFHDQVGTEATLQVLHRLALRVGQIGGKQNARKMTAYYWINQAFRNYAAGAHRRVPGKIMRAVANNPEYLGNRGVWSALVRSALGMSRPKQDAPR